MVSSCSRLQALDPVAAQVGDLARRLVGGRSLGEAAQVLEQDDAQASSAAPTARRA